MLTYIHLQYRPRARALFLLLLALLASASHVALAQPTDSDRTTARELAREGYAALEQKNYAVAEDRFRRADALVHAPTIVVDHARSLVGLGRLVEAYERYALVLREGVAPNAPASWKQAAEDAGREIEPIKPRLAWLVINVEGPTEPRVTVDGREVPVASLGARRATDPGKRKIRVTADGFVSGGRIIVLKEGEEQTISITLERPESVVLEESPTPKDEPKAAEGSPSPLPWIALGVGGAGLAVGAITGSMALAVHSDLSASCPSGKCKPESEAERKAYEDDVSRYHTLGTISGIGFGVGVAGVATGVVLLVTSPSSPPKNASVMPIVGPGFIGVRGRM
ncbi:MAG TPA: hypothetical protein VF103_13295 [Polyangiaceae bacterium]